MATYTVTVRQLVEDTALDEDDKITNPSGTHVIEDARDSEHALDLFHRTVPIACLDDFEISVAPDDADEIDYRIDELLAVRSTYALLMEQFASSTTPAEFKAIEARLTDEENIILKPLAIKAAGDAP
jgi:hypothetical protein